MILLLGTALVAGGGCKQKAQGGPKELLDKFFSSAIRQDYATTYTCYYSPYKEKVSKEDFIKHRKEASVLQSYKIVSLNQDSGSTAQAEVLLTFAPSEKLGRNAAVSTTVKEDLVKEGGEWKIKVW
jgi:hypothetical protein